MQKCLAAFFFSVVCRKMSNRDENELFISMVTLHQLYLHVCVKENQSISSTRNTENRRSIASAYTQT